MTSCAGSALTAERRTLDDHGNVRSETVHLDDDEETIPREGARRNLARGRGSQSGWSSSASAPIAARPGGMSGRPATRVRARRGDYDVMAEEPTGTTGAVWRVAVAQHPRAASRWPEAAHLSLRHQSRAAGAGGQASARARGDQQRPAAGRRGHYLAQLLPPPGGAAAGGGERAQASLHPAHQHRRADRAVPLAPLRSAPEPVAPCQRRAATIRRWTRCRRRRTRFTSC